MSRVIKDDIWEGLRSYIRWTRQRIAEANEYARVHACMKWRLEVLISPWLTIRLTRGDRATYPLEAPGMRTPANGAGKRKSP